MVLVSGQCEICGYALSKYVCDMDFMLKSVSVSLAVSGVCVRRVNLCVVTLTRIAAVFFLHSVLSFCWFRMRFGRQFTDFFYGCCCCVGMQMNTIRIRYTRTHSNVWTFAFHPHKNTQLFAHSQSYHTINTRLCVDIYFITREFCLTLLVRFNFSPACRSGFFSILRVSHGICSMFFFCCFFTVSLVVHHEHAHVRTY